MDYEMIFERILILEHKKDLQNREVAIYPYGTLGKLTEKVLVKEFRVKKIYRIDNNLSDKEIIKFDDFINEKHSNILWILATDRQEVFNELVIQLFLQGINIKDIFILEKGMLPASKALEKVIENNEYRTVLDVGCGIGIHGKILEDYGKGVTGLNISKNNHYQCKCLKNMIYENFLEFTPFEKYDVVWASHIMEHIADEMEFVKKMKNCVRKEGCIAITVPVRESNILLSRVHSYNAGRILRFLICAGIDCGDAQILEYGYNLSVIIPKVYEIEEEVDIKKVEYREVFNAENLLYYLPKEIKLEKSWDNNIYFNGDIKRMNWEPLPSEYIL